MQQGETIDPNPQMESHLLRLATFQNLPESSSLSPCMASKAGFYYTGEGDTVGCYSCGLCLNNWESGVHPMTAHRVLSPNCQFVVTQDRHDVSAEQVESQSAPTSQPAGLSYLCRADRVKCAFCYGILRNWEPSEEPMRKHRRLFPSCPFLRDPRAAGNVALGEEPGEQQMLVSGEWNY